MYSRQIENTIFLQQLYYFKRIRRKIYPTKAFVIVIAAFIADSIDQGFEIVLSLDGNENMRTSNIARLLLKLRMIENSYLFSIEKAPPTFITESNQLDAVWVSLNILPCVTSIVPFYFEVGDYHTFIVDFPREILFRDEFISLARPEMKRLISK